MSGAADEHAHAVVDGELKRLSVSQLKTFALCERRWWFDKVKGIKEEKTKALDDGTAIHEQLEHYLLTGENVLGDVAQSMHRWLPEPDLAYAPGRDLLLEEPLALLTADGIPFTGQVDLTDTRNGLKVTDYKSTSDIEKYAATRTQLGVIDLAAVRAKETPGAPDAGYQMLGYANEMLLRPQFRDVKTVELEHIIGQTGKKGRDSVAPSIKVGAAYARDQWGQHVERGLAPRMRQVARAQTLDDVAPNWNGCGKYGWRGCPHKATCAKHENDKILKRPIGQRINTVGMFDNLKKQQSTLTPSAPPTAQADAPAPKFKIEDQSTRPDAEVKAERDAITQNTAQGPAGVAPGSTEAHTLTTGNGVPSQSAAAPEGAGTSSGTSAEVDKPKRTRRTKAQMEADAAASTSSTAPVSTPAPASAPGPQPLQVAIVFVDCAPNMPTAPLLPYVAALVQKLETDYQVGDIRLAPKKWTTPQGLTVDHPLAYGGWKGALAELVKVNPLAPGVYALSGVSELFEPVVEALAMTLQPGCFVRAAR